MTIRWKTVPIDTIRRNANIALPLTEWNVWKLCSRRVEKWWLWPIWADGEKIFLGRRRGRERALFSYASGGQRPSGKAGQNVWLLLLSGPPQDKPEPACCVAHPFHEEAAVWCRSFGGRCLFALDVDDWSFCKNIYNLPNFPPFYNFPLIFVSGKKKKEGTNEKKKSI